MDLGAAPWRTFRRVTLPLIVPGIIAAALLSFALSIDDFIITFFNAGAEVTFPLQVFGASRAELSPQINVLATMVLLVSVAVMVGVVAAPALGTARAPCRARRRRGPPLRLRRRRVPQAVGLLGRAPGR